MRAIWIRISNGFLSLVAGGAAFIFTLLGFLLLGDVDQQIVASLFIGLFALMVVRMAAERPNSAQARAGAALIERLLAVRRGDLASPAPAAVRHAMPALADAVDGLFEQVRSSLDNFRTMAMYDPVTALPNRIHFRREAERILAARREDDVTALLFIDLDGFKEVNDRLGHAQGDQVLTMVANRLRIVVKAEAGAGATPLLARLAGDEFTILLPDVGNAAEAERIAGLALSALAEPFSTAGHTSQMGASIGVALCPDHGGELTALMKAADLAMYHAKASGRARVCLYEPALARASEARAALAASLQQAVEQGQVAFAYRPRLCLRTGAILAGDASLWWNRPGEPSVAIEGLGIDSADGGLEQWLAGFTLASAVAAYDRWQAAALPQRLCFRLSTSQLVRGEFAPAIHQTLAAARQRNGLLELEVAAGDLALVPGHVSSDLEGLRRLGVTVAVGGFGAADSNLTALRGFPVDRVKLDPVLIEDVEHDARARAMLSSVLHLIHGLGCEAVATGVAHEEQLAILRIAGCDSVEGFLGADPLDEDAFVAWVSAQDCARSLARAS
ncbi:MAG TPA: diguanylate cyclase [Allosphingosinicella sp.]|nr:diguanylate cyclase [Allosphingosinicella sp.]